ncbi:DUF7830 domain-containing protein [Pseudomonas fluorescens]|uniref:DUF7830 domain-containing protein n=2 Tax=Pseudomonas fluorescens TaxID=294 RepID=UPI003F8836E5
MFTYDVAQPTDQMLLSEILSLDSGEPLDVDAFLRRDLVVVIQDRNELTGRYARDLIQPWLVCRICLGAVMLVLTKQRRFLFRHIRMKKAPRAAQFRLRGHSAPIRSIG